MTKPATMLLAAALILAAATANARANEEKPLEKSATLATIEKVNNAWQKANKPEVNAFWDNAVYFTGNMEAYRVTGKAAYQEYSDKWARHNKWSGATEKNPNLWLYKTYGEGQRHVLFGDWQTCFQTYIDMYEANPDAYKIARATEVMSRECAMGQTDFWWWADALYMAMPVMSKMFRATGDYKYLDKLCDNFKYADSLMFDEAEGLYYRDAKYIYPKHKTEQGKKDFWARGNGWVIAGLAKVLADMPRDYNGRALLEQRFKQIADAAARCQQTEGHWTRSMLDPKQAEGFETSGTALLAYGLFWGMNNGIISRDKYQITAEKAWSYLANKALQADGTVGYVQPIGEKAVKGQTLTAKNTANFGTGAFLLAACEKLRFSEITANTKGKKEMKITVGNPSNTFRQEVVELDAKAVFQTLSISGGRLFKVMNAVGQEVAYQLTYDGKLLIDAAVRPGGTATFTIKRGTPKTFVNTCYGRMYPERVDDIAWENDRGAYRCYGPALQRSGEDAFGNDVWVKNTPDLVVEQRYFVEDTNKPIIAKLKTTDKAAADSLNMLTSYHFDHGHGLDCYKVGPTLGCGTPAIMNGESIVFPYCYKEYELLDNGPLRFTVRLTYNPTTINGDANVVETRILSLDKGSNFNKMTVSYSGLTKPADIASGVVIHTEDTESVVLGKDYVQYADPTDNPAGQNFQIYVAALFPNGVSETKKIMYDNPTRGNAGHALGIVRGYKGGDNYTYYFGSTWSKYDCKSQAEWQLRINAFMDALKNPLKVSMD